MINLFFHSENSGFIKLNNILLGETLNVLKVSIKNPDGFLLEFFPPNTNDFLSFSARMSFSTTLEIESEFVEIVKFDFENYLIILKQKPLVEPQVPKTSFFENFILDKKPITINLLDSYEQTLLVSNGERFLTHIPKHKIINPKVVINDKLGLFAIYNNAICILDSDLNVIFEGKNCKLSSDFKTVTVKNEFTDIKKHLIIQTFNFSSNTYKLAKTEFMDDKPNQKINSNKTVIFLFLESLVAGFEKECLGYLTEDLRDSTDFTKIQDFILPFENYYECLSANDDQEDCIFISYKQQKNVYLVHKLKFIFEDGKIADVDFI